MKGTTEDSVITQLKTDRDRLVQTLCQQLENTDTWNQELGESFAATNRLLWLCGDRSALDSEHNRKRG